MGETKSPIRQTIYLACPGCDKELIESKWASRMLEPWDSTVENRFWRSRATCKWCDKGYDFVYDKKNKNLEFAQQSKPDDLHGIMLVKRPNEHVYLVVETSFCFCAHRYNTDLTYWVNSGTCPTNWLDVALIAENGDVDPHGVFEFVRAFTYKEIESRFNINRGVLLGEDCAFMDENEAFIRIFPELESSEGDEGLVIEGVGESVQHATLSLENKGDQE